MKMDERKGELISAAKELFQTRGLTNTSIANIADKVGVTRSLFYHYFANKQAIVDAVIDENVDEFMRRLEQFELGRKARYEDKQARVHGALYVVRSSLVGEDSFGRHILTEKNALLRQQFCVRASKRFANKCAQMDQSSGLLEKRYGIRYPQATMYVLCIGVMSLLFQDPDVPDEVLVEAIASVMHLDI